MNRFAWCGILGFLVMSVLTEDALAMGKKRSPFAQSVDREGDRVAFHCVFEDIHFYDLRNPLTQQRRMSVAFKMDRSLQRVLDVSDTDETSGSAGQIEKLKGAELPVRMRWSARSSLENRYPRAGLCESPGQDPSGGELRVPSWEDVLTQVPEQERESCRKFFAEAGEDRIGSMAVEIDVRPGKHQSEEARLTLLDAETGEIIVRSGSCRAMALADAGFGPNLIIQALSMWQDELEGMRSQVETRIAALNAALARLEQQRNEHMAELGADPDPGYVSMVTGVFARMRAGLLRGALHDLAAVRAGWWGE